VIGVSADWDDDAPTRPFRGRQASYNYDYLCV